MCFEQFEKFEVSLFDGYKYEYSLNLSTLNRMSPVCRIVPI